MVFLHGQWSSLVLSCLTVMVVGGFEVSTTIEKCPPPRCVTYEEINTLWADPSPAHFLQCRPLQNGTWAPQKMPCAVGTLFSFKQQVCVLEINWNAELSGCIKADTKAPSCGEPSCETYEQINTLWVHSLKEKFYQCRPAPNGTWVPQEMLCPTGTLFSFYHQVCVVKSMWKDSCSQT
ncbi:uncharacterized protein LOC118503168 [Anopheles stephensi]|uniref:Chitin-binding type-2 domain-containing protein n=1 Tax=Anopheles stephensi TaxID=30069 RepID=A0A182Y4Z9_ANOST|nr:uncharacterized protein LOC118503168 [Anopheles stephensi]